MEPIGRRWAKDHKGDRSFTPRWLVHLVDALVEGIDTDPAWHPSSHVRPRLVRCAGPEEGGLDGLATRWRGSVWCNPPYSRPAPWVAACEAHAADGHRVALLLKSDTSTRWFAGLWRADARVFFSSRLKFEGYGGNVSAPFPSVLACWNIPADEVHAAFDDLAHVDENGQGDP